MGGAKLLGSPGSSSGMSGKMSVLRVGVRRADSPSRVSAMGMAEGGGGRGA